MKLLQPSEHQLQVDLCRFLETAGNPQCLWTAIENGGKRSIGTARKLKAAGLKPGTPDMIFLLERRTFFLELKIKGGRVSPEQKAFRDNLWALGHEWFVAWTLDEAIKILREAGALRKGI